MSVRHLEDLQAALTAAGWQVSEVRPGNDYDIAGSWCVKRPDQGPALIIDFDGQNDMSCLPIEQSYGCKIRGASAEVLYFRRINRSKALWQRELMAFVAQLHSAAQQKVPADGLAAPSGRQARG